MHFFPLQSVLAVVRGAKDMSKKSVEGNLQISIYKMAKDKTIDDLKSCVIEAGYLEQKLKNPTQDGYSFLLFHKYQKFTPKWKSFIAPIVALSEPILATAMSAQQNYILFIYNAKIIFAVTGGYGHNAIRENIDDNFGLDVLSRFIKKEDKILKSSRERSFVGGDSWYNKVF